MLAIHNYLNGSVLLQILLHRSVWIIYKVQHWVNVKMEGMYQKPDKFTEEPPSEKNYT